MCGCSHLLQTPLSIDHSQILECKLHSNGKTSVESLKMLPFTDLLLMKTLQPVSSLGVKGQETLKKKNLNIYMAMENQGQWNTSKRLFT